jgi:hypothetical protein
MDVSDGQSVTEEAYLLLWLGIIGSAVGLYVPSSLLVEIDEYRSPCPGLRGATSSRAESDFPVVPRSISSAARAGRVSDCRPG